MDKYYVKCAKYNPYKGMVSDSEPLFTIENYKDINWDYILDEAIDLYENNKEDFERYDIKTMVEPHWHTEPQEGDTEACLIVGEVQDTVCDGYKIEDDNTITEENYYIGIDNRYYEEQLKECINTKDTLLGWDNWFCKLIEATGNDCNYGDSFYCGKQFDLSDEGEYFILDTVYCETFNGYEHGFCVTLKIEKNELTEYLTEFIGENIEMDEEILDNWDREIKLELVHYSLI